MYVAFYDDTIVMDGGSAIKDYPEEVLALVKEQHPDPEWDLLTIYELSRPIHSDGQSIEWPRLDAPIPVGMTSEYAGYTIKEGREGAWLLLKDGANVMPAAAGPLTRDDCFMAADVLKVIDGDGQKFWHLWRAIRGTDERESHTHKQRAQ